MKRSVLVDQHGGLLEVVVAGANAHDQRRLAATLDALVLPCPQPPPAAPQHRCLDTGFASPPAERAVRARGYRPRIRRLGEETRAPGGTRRYPARRWVVERALAWLSKGRALFFGALALVWPGLTLLTLVLLFGAYGLVDDFLTLVSGVAAIASQGRGGLRLTVLLQGLAGITIGLAAYLLPHRPPWPYATSSPLGVPNTGGERGRVISGDFVPRPLFGRRSWVVVTGLIQIGASVQQR